jgi:hypothetical protein
MPLETRVSSAAENRYAMLLAVSEAANAQLDFVGVLEAVARVLRPGWERGDGVELQRSKIPSGMRAETT